MADDYFETGLAVALFLYLAAMIIIQSLLSCGAFYAPPVDLKPATPEDLAEALAYALRYIAASRHFETIQKIAETIEW
jgi:hypothetical protein